MVKVTNVNFDVKVNFRCWIFCLQRLVARLILNSIEIYSLRVQNVLIVNRNYRNLISLICFKQPCDFKETPMITL